MNHKIDNNLLNNTASYTLVAGHDSVAVVAPSAPKKSKRLKIVTLLAVCVVTVVLATTVVMLIDLYKPR